MPHQVAPEVHRNTGRSGGGGGGDGHSYDGGNVDTPWWWWWLRHPGAVAGLSSGTFSSLHVHRTMAMIHSSSASGLVVIGAETYTMVEE